VLAAVFFGAAVLAAADFRAVVAVLFFVAVAAFFRVVAAGLRAVLAAAFFGAAVLAAGLRAVVAVLFFVAVAVFFRVVAGGLRAVLAAAFFGAAALAAAGLRVAVVLLAAVLRAVPVDFAAGFAALAVAFAGAFLAGAAAAFFAAAGLRPAVLAFRVVAVRRLVLIAIGRARPEPVSLLSSICWLSLPLLYWANPIYFAVPAKRCRMVPLFADQDGSAPEQKAGASLIAPPRVPRHASPGPGHQPSELRRRFAARFPMLA
jgi:hypothetical protein